MCVSFISYLNNILPSLSILYRTIAIYVCTDIYHTLTIAISNLELCLQDMCSAFYEMSFVVYMAPRR